MNRAPHPIHADGKPRYLGSSLTLGTLTVLLVRVHTWLVWTAMDGRAGFSNGMIPWRDDHPLYFHSALVTRHFLAQNGTTAGYDPAFMAGYAKSVVFPSSSTLPEVVVALFGRFGPVEVYKAYILVSASLIAWLISLAAVVWRAGPGGTCAAVALFLLYVWSDFPMRYAQFGMLPYLLAIPLGLLATGLFCFYCERGGFVLWLVAAGLLSLDVMVHFTSAMIVAPAAAAAVAALYGANRYAETPLPRLRHVGIWSIPVAIVAANAFWWLPALWLLSTKGVSDFAFAHPEGFWQRIWQIGTTEQPIERVLCGLGLCGLGLLFTTPLPWPRKVGLVTFIAFGFFWGYMSGSFRSLDFLQPGRHTFAFFSGLCVTSGILLSQAFGQLRQRWRFRTDVLAAVLLCGFIAWYVGPGLVKQLQARVFARVPLLSSHPSPWLQWVIRNVKAYVKPGERMLYEEGGFAVKGVADPFQGGRFSGILADRLGVELVGGPYLHASLTTNFTQFGEGKLFEKADWDRDWFVRYAHIYRPDAILCWTPKARSFCLANPDIVNVKEGDGTVLLGRVIGFAGPAIQGKAEVMASPGKLHVTQVEGGLDGTVVLRYHSVPCLRTDPPVEWEPVYLEDDPVPFIKLRPPQSGTVTFEMRLPPGRMP